MKFNPCCGHVALPVGLKIFAGIDAGLSLTPVIFYGIWKSEREDNGTDSGTVVIFGILAGVVTFIEIILSVLLIYTSLKPNSRDCTGWTWIVITILFRTAQIIVLGKFNDIHSAELESLATSVLVTFVLISVFKLYGMVLLYFSMKEGDEGRAPPPPRGGPRMIIGSQMGTADVYSTSPTMMTYGAAPVPESNFSTSDETNTGQQKYVGLTF